MKILEIIYSLCSGGAERFVVDLSNRLSDDKSNEVVILVINDLRKKECSHFLPDVNENIRVISLNHNGLGICSIIGLFRVIRREKPEIVHCHSNIVLLYLPVLFIKRPRYIHTLHSLAEKCLHWGCCKQINNYLYSKKVQAITISKECSQSYRSLYGMDNDRMIINGREKILQTPDFEKAKEEVETLTDGKRPVFINVARCDQAKNHQLLFEVFERLYEEENDAQLLVLGSGHNANADKYRNHPNIHIIGERRNVEDYFACADFFILSSVYEGLPLTLLEAMSMGVVPVCTPAGGIKDVIRDGKNGFLSSDLSFENFFNTIKRAINDKTDISSEEIEREYMEKYSMQKCYEQYLIVYRKV